MSETIYNPDGTVYMTLPDPVPSTGDLEGWVIRHVCSGTHGPNCPHPRWMTGTASLVRVDVESFNSLLRIVADLDSIYGTHATSHKIVGRTYRWTWEREYPDGHRGSDMIIASKIED